jgi:hypothetical protein
VQQSAARPRPQRTGRNAAWLYPSGEHPQITARLLLADVTANSCSHAILVRVKRGQLHSRLLCEIGWPWCHSIGPDWSTTSVTLLPHQDLKLQ